MTQTIKCVAKRMQGGGRHEHITEIWWEQIDDGGRVLDSGNATMDDMVTFIRTNGPRAVWCPDEGAHKGCAWLAVQTDGISSFVQAVVDGKRTDSLLDLPER